MNRFLPFVLSAIIVVADQISKLLVVTFIEPYSLTRDSVGVIGNFVTFIRTQNPGVAFSVGQSWPPLARRLLFIFLPLVVVVLASLYLVRERDLSRLQRWMLAGIVGGGVGNLIDRIARADGVVDFILFRMYGFLGQEFFPVFNLADSAVTICAIVLATTLIFHRQETLAEPNKQARPGPDGRND